MSQKLPAARIVRAAQAVIETLEARQLMSTTTVTDPSAAQPLAATAVAQAQPSVIATSPAAGAMGVTRDVSITADLNLPNSGLDPSTLNAATVQLFRTSDHSQVAAVVNTSGGGDSIILQPATNLDPNTQYTFNVTSGVKDTSGASMTPFSMSFTTGATFSAADPSLQFQKVTLPSAQGVPFTSVRIGPDHLLYASSEDGRIFRYPINGDGTLGTPQIITSLQAANGGPRLVTGFAFDPHSTASNVVLWVANSYYATQNAPDWTGKISVMSGPNLETVRDAVVNLPRSNQDHGTEEPTFGPDGALYVPQGSMNAMGAPDTTWGMRPEHLLSAAILRLDTTRITPGQPLNAMTVDAGGPYNPFATGAPLTLYATGVRNAFSLLWTSDGQLYAPTNGSSAGGNTPAFPSSVNGPRIDTGQPYNGPAVPGLTNVPESEIDWLFNIQQGGYYGHPDPARGEFVLDAGNPANSTDPNIIPQYPVGTQPDPNYRGYAYNFGAHRSPDGIIEYQDHTFGGLLQGKLLVTEYSAGDDIIVLTRDASGNIVNAQRGIAGFTGFNNPVNLTEDPATGDIYVAELGGQRLTLLRPIPPRPVANIDKTLMVFNDVLNQAPGAVGSSPLQSLTIMNTGTTPLSLGSITVVNDPTAGTQDAASFVITNLASLPASIAPGQSVVLTLSYTARSIGIQKALLQIHTNDAANPLQTVSLHGIGTPGTGGANEPSLAEILRAFDIPTIVGDGPNDANAFASTFYPATPDASSQEVAIQRLMKAGDGPVTITPIAAFAVPNQPGLRFGYYTPGDQTDRHELFWVNKSDSQAVNPNAQGATAFDPGGNEFSLYANFPTFTDNGQQRISYSEDSLNAWDAAVPRKFRFFPLENADGTIVPNTYVFAAEDNNIPFGSIQPYDSNDIVGIIRNVKPAPGNGHGPVLGLQNLDGAPFNDRLMFSRVANQNPTFGDINHDYVTLRLRNTGDQPLQITTLKVSDPNNWMIVNPPKLPFMLGANGGSYDLQIRFIATAAPPHTDNQTNDTKTEEAGISPIVAGGVWNGTLTIISSDPARPGRTVQLAGYWQRTSENEEEPSLQTITNLLAGYDTIIANTQLPNYPEGTTPVYYGEEVPSAYWNVADASLPVSVVQLASYHNQVDPSTGKLTSAYIGWYKQGSTLTNKLFFNQPDSAQSVLPPLSGGTGVAQISFNPTGTFGWNLDSNFSDDSRNTVGGGGGHHVRFYPVRDRQGNLIPNTWIAALDYGGSNFENYDFQDNVYLISNMRPANAAPSPTDAQATVAPAGGIALQWGAVTDSSLIGYNVYRSTSPTGTFTKLNSSLLTGTRFVDPFAPVGVTSYYKITAVDSAGEAVGISVAGLTPPAAPTSLAATALSAGQVKLTWTAPTSGLTYRIEREVLGGSSFTEIASGVLGSTFTDSTVVGNTTYVYQVRSENTAGLSPYSTVATVATPAAPTPSAPTGLAATSATPNLITISWTASTGTVSRYHVERMGPGDTAFVEIATVATGTTFTDTTVSPASNYVYRVRAENAGSFSDYSNMFGLATPASAPAAPTGLKAITGDSGITLAWTAPAGPVVDYRIERVGAGDAGFVQIAAGVTSATFVDKTAVPGITYTYRVRGENLGGISPYSNTAAATAVLAPGAGIRTALPLGTLEKKTIKVSKRTVTPDQSQTYFVFNLNALAKVTLKLSNFKDVLGLDVLDLNGNVVASANSGKKRSLSMTTTLATGRYYLRLRLLGTKGTLYTMTMSGRFIKVPVKHTSH